MLSNLNKTNLGSFGMRSRVLALCVGISALTGCIIVDSDSNSTIIDDTPPPPVITEPMRVNIASDVALDAIPGDGVGVFVEYYAGGTYRIWTTCDTTFSGNACAFDIFTSVDSSSNIVATTEEDLEGVDTITVNPGQGTVDLRFDTGGDYDSAVIDVTPGAILRLEAFVDGASDPRFVYWFGNGVLHEGAPTNPVDFAPTKP
jgi:hypothetical protein